MSSSLNARMRNNLEVAARANALKPGTIGIEFGDTPAENARQRYYTECLNRFALEAARERRQVPVPPPARVSVSEVRAPRRTNGSSGRPRATTRSSSSESGDSGDDSDSEPPASAWRWAQPQRWGVAGPTARWHARALRHRHPNRHVAQGWRR
jgi:hypothetical protein